MGTHKLRGHTAEPHSGFRPFSLSLGWFFLCIQLASLCPALWFSMTRGQSCDPCVSPQGSSAAGPAGIPQRRAPRPRPGPLLSHEEATRIARIFSAQLCKKE